MKIGFCFLIKETINNFMFWKRYFDNISFDDYQIFIHPKDNNYLPTLKNSITLQNTINTRRSSVSLTYATHLLFDEAIKYNCDYMILLSGDMIPLVSFDTLKTHLNKSIFSTLPQDLQFNVLKSTKIASYESLPDGFKNKISLEIFRKQIMFFGITKKDYLVIQNNKHHITDFSKTYPPDEFYFVNMFLYLNLSFDETNDQQFIFCHYNKLKSQSLIWNIYKNEDKEITFSVEKSKITMNKLTELGYLFIRKIPNNFIVNRELICN